MRKAYASPVPLVARTAARSFGTLRKPDGITHRVAAVAREIWTLKTAVNLSAETGYSVRCCENWLYNSASIPADALGSLIRSEYGAAFLAAVIEDAPPVWYRAATSSLGAFNARRRRQQLETELKAAIDADDAAHEAIQRADLALSLPNKNSRRPRALASRDVGRSQTRAVARKRGAH